ncbi:MAG: DEAD/DEAH box helicase [bacterium]|nr:DEAD/DEAH box helicase [bacterium]
MIATRTPLAPGARILVRDEEWLVTRVEPTRTGGQLVTATGLSELVRDREVTFLDELEPRIDVLRPEDTVFVADPSPRFLRSRLYLEGRLRKLPPSGEPGTIALQVGHRAHMDVLAYQLVPAHLALSQPRPRILIADAVGLGKTLEAGILLSELIHRGRAKRILVVTVKSMMAQFQDELWNRFAIPLVKLDSVGLARIARELPAHANPFHHHDRVIVSLDTLKQDRAYRTHLERSRWDVIVIDEAHHVAERGSGSQRHRLATLLAGISDGLILLSATPHDGRARSFASLMRMLDPTAIADPDHYTPEDIRGLYVRRFKADVQHELQQAFPPREVREVWSDATPAEDAAIDALLNVPVVAGPRRNAGQMLFRTVLEKAFFSSPAACLATTRERLRKATDAREVAALEILASALERIEPSDVSKLSGLAAMLASEGWTGQDPEDRLVVFTERRETLAFLEAHLPRLLKLPPQAVLTMHGSMSDTDLHANVAAFTRRAHPVRLLLATDVAAEGLNLHPLCHRLVHYDVPWSLMLFQQRNGRIDRYGQPRTPLLRYLMTRHADARIGGDQRILELLVKKDTEVQNNLGDPATVLGVYDVAAEEHLTAAAIEQANTTFLDGSDEDDAFLALFRTAATAEASPQAAGATPAPGPGPVVRAHGLSLWPSDRAYLEAGLQSLATTRGLVIRDAGPEVVAFEIPEDLRFRLERGPAEANPYPHPLRLTADRSRLEEAIRDGRAAGKPPDLQVLWPLHPAMQWLDDRLASELGRDGKGRQLAPVLVRPRSLAPDEVAMVVVGIVPDRHGRPVVQAWLSVRLRANGVPRVEPFAELVAACGLDADDWVNPGDALDPGVSKRLQTALGPVLVAARDHLALRREAHRAVLEPRAAEHLERLSTLKNRQVAHLEATLAGRSWSEARIARERAQGLRALEAEFDRHAAWIRETHALESQAHVLVLAALVPSSRA